MFLTCKNIDLSLDSIKILIKINNSTFDNIHTSIKKQTT